MAGELRQALALLYKRIGERTASETDLTKVMSLTLNWAKPSQAPHLLARGVNAGLLDKQEDIFTVTFEPDAIEIPFGFKPSEDLFSEVEMPADTVSSPPDGPADEGQDEGEPPTEPEAAKPPPATGQRPVLEELLDEVAEHLEGGRKAAIAKVNARQDELEGMVTLDAAALIVAAEHGVAVAQAAERVLDELRIG